MSRSLCAPLVGAVYLALLAPSAGAQQPASPPSVTTVAAAPALGSTAPAAQQTPLAVKAPAPNRVNEILPAWLRVRGEFRERVEGFAGLGFTPDRDDAYALTRFRLNASVTPSPALAFQVQVQDARVARKQVGPTASPFRGPFDLRLASADIGSAKSPVAARIGRQELAFGEQRLLGHLNWTNTARSFDAARLILRSKPFQVDIFAASLVHSLPDSFDKSGNGNRLFGAYGSAATLIPTATVEPFLIVRHDGNVRSERGVLGSLEQSTFGFRLAGRLSARLDYNGDVAVQRGSLDTDAVRAWAARGLIRATLGGSANLKLVSEYNYATGDSDPTDGRRQTFDQLYPTGHDKYGLADQVGWRNVHHIREGFEFTPLKATPISVNYHSWWLAETADALYSAAGAPIARVTGEAADSHVGQELDVQIARNVTPQIAVAAGYSHIFTGAFLKQTTPGASYSQPYVMVTYVFLAEK